MSAWIQNPDGSKTLLEKTLHYYEQGQAELPEAPPEAPEAPPSADAKKPTKPAEPTPTPTPAPATTKEPK